MNLAEVTEAYPDYFDGEFDPGNGETHSGHFNWTEVVGEVGAKAEPTTDAN